jgi:hypothetical protein
MTGPLFAHQGNGRLRDIDDPEQVGLYLSPELGKTRVLNWAYIAITCVVGEDIKPSEGLSRYRNSIECRLLVRHIKSYSADLISIPRGKIAEVLRVASCRNQLVAGVKHCLSKCAPQSSRTSSD